MEAFLAVLAMGFDVVFLTGRGHVDVPLGLGGKVAGSFGDGDDVDVATGIELQVTIALYARREMKGGLSPFISKRQFMSAGDTRPLSKSWLNISTTISKFEQMAEPATASPWK
ncbi:hypothetical protein LOY49_15150 [Pseudomonas atacamensis]|jgi:hypothetical protein|uniref:Uncharacterized protein n=1 Tax=Pseudomonas atacamensis TaxID=2565368 RepID=A0ABQ5PGB9_9PSED|nr:hypothetical protein [Pseudomonas atacamensis]UVK91576.1 hypothetical protein LOY49_15150 [Pseudomonas atacamensis]GLH42559.1 hypothetical protein RS3R1_16460 [Pseudomonas atacamensis]GLH54142.1 hypothetical protein RS3R6_23240 [Pseudomonas atacamensis]